MIYCAIASPLMIPIPILKLHAQRRLIRVRVSQYEMEINCRTVINIYAAQYGDRSFLQSNSSLMNEDMRTAYLLWEN